MGASRTLAFVQSDKPGNDRSGELADFGYYCKTRLYWPLDVDEALQRCTSEWCY